MFPVVLVQVLVVLVVVGLFIWAIGQFPIDPTIARIIRVVAIVAVSLYLLSLFVPIFSAGSSAHYRYFR